MLIDGQVCFYKQPFADAVEPQGCIFLAQKGINRTAWVTKLLLTAVLSSPVDCISWCQILKAQHCSLSLNGYFTSPSAPHSPPTHPPPIDSIRDITGLKISVKPAAFKHVASRISYEMIATYVTTLFMQDIWRDCIVPQEKYSALNISN